MKDSTYQKFKLQYRKLLETGMVISLLFCVILFQGSKRFEISKDRIQLELPKITQIDAVATEHKVKKAQVAKPTIPVPSVEEDIFDPEDIFTLPDILNMPEPPVPTEIDEPHFKAVQKQAVPIGGFKAILHHLEYPELAKLANIEGRVVVWAKIDEKGNVVKTQIYKSIGFEACDQNAMKAIQAVKWEPAMQRDKPVTVWVSVPVDFKLR
ncbi:energy transducer TonB [bacterium]|nr:energy transducer TonB [bacterium]